MIRARRPLSAVLALVFALAMLPIDNNPQHSAAFAAAPPADVSYNSVEFVDRDNGWIAGSNGTIIRTTNGGDDWEQLSVGTAAEFVSISFADLERGWALTRDARVWRTVNGGDTWTLMPAARYGSTDLVGPTFYSPEAHAIEVTDGGRTFFSANKFAPGPHPAGNVGLLYRSNAEGTGWEGPVLEAPDHRHPDDETPLGESQFRDIEFVDQNTGWVVGTDFYAARTSPFRPKPIVYKTTTGGGPGTWSTQPLPTATDFVSLNGVSFASASVGMAVGDNGRAVRTINGGTTWSLIPTTGTTRKLNDVFMLDATRAWAVGEGGTIKRTTDGGLNWTDGSAQDAGVSLRSVKLVGDPLRGWLAGAAGRIRITTDGQNWYPPATPPHTERPSIPTGVVASATSASSIQVSWNPSSDASGIKHYLVYLNGILRATVTGTSASISSLSPSTTYSVTVEAVDNANNPSVASAAVSVTTPAPPDTTAPTIPTGVTASATSSTAVRASWSPSSDGSGSGIKHYLVYLNGILRATVAGTSASISSLSPSTTYSVTVEAVDNANNPSVASAAVSVTTPAPPDTTPPTVPTGVVASATSPVSVRASWKPSSDASGIKHYLVYLNGALRATVTGTSASISSLTPSTTYSVTVRAVDRANKTSAASAAVSVRTPAKATITFSLGSSGSAANAVRMSTYTHTLGRSYTTFGYFKPRRAINTQAIVRVLAYRYERKADGTMGYVYKRSYLATVTNPAGSEWSKYSASVTLPSRGTWRLRVRYYEDAWTKQTTSGYRYVTVR